MKIVVLKHSSVQCAPDDYKKQTRAYIFDENTTLKEIISNISNGMAGEESADYGPYFEIPLQCFDEEDPK